MTYAIFTCIEKIINDNRNGYSILLSKQDYPIKSKKHINNFLVENNGSDFIEIVPIKDMWPNQWRMRLYDYWFCLNEVRENAIILPNIFNPSFYRKKNISPFFRVLITDKRLSFKYEVIKNVLKPRIYPKNIETFGGSNWYALTIETLNKIIFFVRDNKKFIDYHRYTLAPEEIIFQTIICYLMKTGNDIKVLDTLTYANWKRTNTQLPVTFTSADFNEIISQPEGKLLASKFDITLDEKILDKLDNHIDN